MVGEVPSTVVASRVFAALALRVVRTHTAIAAVPVVVVPVPGAVLAAAPSAAGGGGCTERWFYARLPFCFVGSKMILAK